MKTSTLSALTGVSVSVFLSVSCTKNESEQINAKKKQEATCDVAVFTQQYSGGEAGYIFNKTYDFSGRKLSHISAPLYSGGAIWDTVHLNLTYDYNKIYFISSENSSDTGLVVQIDNAGRPVRAEVGQIIDNGFGPQEFFYQGGRLRSINIDNDWMRIWFRYDQYGNNTQIVTDSSDGLPRINHVYEYNRSKTASQQFYLDEARGFSFNVLTILHAAGFFTELNPVHARVRSTVHWGSYLAYDYIQRNHVYDKSGRLLQYETASPGSSSSLATYTVNYNCASSNNKELITYAQ
jgi:hypothetical protein